MYQGQERRKNLSDNFTPNGAFEGYVYASIENIKEQIKNLPCPEEFKRLGKCETDIANIEGRASIFGIVFGFIAGIFAKIFLK